MKKAEKAFTLVELLVVISIIALLLAILMPALAKVKEQGRTVVCGTNLKNYGLAIQMYASANNDRFSDQYWLYSLATIDLIKTTKGVARECLWHYEGDIKPDGNLFKYLRDKNVNMCPTFKAFAMAGGLSGCPSKSKHSSGGKGSSATTFSPGFSYSGNAAICGWRTYGTSGPIPDGKGGYLVLSLKVSDVKRPAQCMAFSEENIWPIYKGERIKEGNLYDYATARLNDNLLDIEYNLVSDNIGTYHKVGAAKRNDGYANCVFVDGHVSSTWGRSGPEAYLGYAKPYDGHESLWKR